MSKTRAVVIGISHYLDNRLPALPAAQIDAVHFARALTHWGISDICLLLNEEATVDQLISLFGQDQEEAQFVFFFCGHGQRTGDSNPHSDLHLFDGPLKLDSLIWQIYQLSSQENYLFIDACSLRLNTILNPKFEDEIRGQKESKKNFFCLLSSGIQNSYENYFYGYFTHALLKTLAKLRKKELDPTQLYKEICHYLEGEKLPLPEMYNIGTQKISLFNEQLQPLLQRIEMQAKIEDALILNRGKIGILIGEKGSGKTALTQFFLTKIGRTYCVKAPAHNSISLRDYLTLQLKEIEEWSCSLILIDDADQIDLKQFIKDTMYDQTQYVLLSGHSMKEKLPFQLADSVFQIELDPFTLEETEELLLPSDYTKNEKKLIWVASQGNPLKIHQLAQHLKQDTAAVDRLTKKEMLKVISAIYSCGSFIEKKLFAEVFDLSLSSIDLLENLGLICWDADAWVPHHLLNEIAENEPTLIRLNQEKAIEYWYRQLKPKKVNHIWSFWVVGLALIIVAACLGYSFLSPTSPHHVVNLRQTHSDFVGRETYLKQLQNICLKFKKSPSIAVLWGEAGIGKSEIATAFANEQASHFHVIGWIDSETEESYAASYYTLAKLLEVPIDKETNVVKKVHHYLEIESKAQPWLLILDNADHNRELPTTGKGSIIVTTRNRTQWPLQNCIEVTSFQKNEAIQLFQKITSNSSQNYDLIKELDFFPLTLNLAAHYIAETPDMNAELYLKLLSQNELELISSMPEDTRYPNTLLSSWNLKATELIEKDREVLDWLHFCSYLCPSGIPSSWIEEWLIDQKKGDDRFALKIRSGDILRTLVNHSLMRYEKQTHTLSLHRLNQEVIKKDRYFRKEVIEQISAFLMSRAEKIEKIYEKEKTSKQWNLRDWEPHVAWFLSHTASFLSKEKEAALQNLLANWKYIKGEYQAAQTYHEQALKTRIELLGKEHPQTLISMNNLATVLWEKGQLAQSKKLFAEALTGSKKLYSEEHIEITIAMNNLGWVYWELGEFQEAKALLKQSLSTSKKLRACDPDFLQTANDFIQVLDDFDPLSEKATTRALFLRHAGLWVAEVEGNPNKSIGYFKESLKLLQQTLSENDPRIAIALGSLGISFNRAGQSEEGRHYLSEAVKIQKLVLGDDHPETAKSYANLAISYLNLKKFPEAYEYHKKALDIRRRILGEEHPITAKSYSGTGMALLNMKKPQEALFFNQKALTIRQKVLGEGHSETSQSYSRLGMNYSKLGQHDKALELNLKALEIQKKNFGEDHFLTANAYSSLGVCYRESGQLEKGVESEKKAESIRQLFSR